MRDGDDKKMRMGMTKRSCPIYRAIFKTADPALDGTRESANYKKYVYVRRQRMTILLITAMGK